MVVRSLKIVLLGLLSSTALSVENTANPTKLSDFVHLALSNAKLVTAAQQNSEAARLNAEVTRKQNWPKLRLESSHGLVGSDPNVNPATGQKDSNWASSFSLGARWLLLDNGEQSHAMSLADIEAKAAELKIESQKLELVRKVAQLYFQVQALLAQETISTSLEKTLRTQYSSTERMFRQGLKPRRDYQRMLAELKRTQLDQEGRRRQLERVIMQLASTVGGDFASIAKQVSAQINFPAKSSKIVQSEIKAVVPSLADQIDQLALNAARLKAERSSAKRYLPELGFALNAQYGADSYMGTGVAISDRDRTTWSALLSLNMDLWDWGAKRSTAAADWASFQSTIAALSNEQDARKLEIELARENLEDQLRQYDLVKDLLTLQEENYSSVEGEFRQGKLGYVDLITALRDLSTSRRQLYDSYFRIQNQLVEVRYYEGNLDEWVKGF